MDAVMTVWPSEVHCVLCPGQKGESRRTVRSNAAAEREAAHDEMVGHAVMSLVRDGATNISIREENHDD